MGRSLLLTARSLFTYSWSSLLTVTLLGLFYLRLKVGLVFFAYGGNFGLVFFAYGGKFGLVFCAYGSPCPEIGFGMFCLRFRHCK